MIPNELFLQNIIISEYLNKIQMNTNFYWQQNQCIGKNANRFLKYFFTKNL